MSHSPVHVSNLRFFWVVLEKYSSLFGMKITTAPWLGYLFSFLARCILVQYVYFLGQELLHMGAVHTCSRSVDCIVLCSHNQTSYFLFTKKKKVFNCLKPNRWTLPVSSPLFCIWPLCLTTFWSQNVKDVFQYWPSVLCAEITQCLLRCDGYFGKWNNLWFSEYNVYCILDLMSCLPVILIQNCACLY